jgi:hypothetical protein
LLFSFLSNTLFKLEKQAARCRDGTTATSLTRATRTGFQ